MHQGEGLLLLQAAGCGAAVQRRGRERPPGKTRSRFMAYSQPCCLAGLLWYEFRLAPHRLNHIVVRPARI